MNKDHIQILISRYFEATATAEEERQLKEILADPTTEATPEVEEARAVIGYTAIERKLHTPDKQASTNNGSRWRAMTIAAASAAAAITLGWSFLNNDNNPYESNATIYAQGRVIESTDQAMAIMEAQLGAMGKASENSAATNALNALGEMMNEE